MTESNDSTTNAERTAITTIREVDRPDDLATDADVEDEFGISIPEGEMCDVELNIMETEGDSVD